MPKKRADRDRTDFGKRMLRAREWAGMTQLYACARLQMSQGTLTRLEGSSEGTTRLVEFAELYRVDPMWLATGIGIEPDWSLPPDLRKLDRYAMAQDMARAFAGMDIEMRARAMFVLEALKRDVPKAETG